ncbi:AMP-binding protein, partial [Porphyromonas gingivalis]|uniref:AMP-binding protein n=1 Tax=Porphyromonas gingivalis TaxID=837 RepID=UPI001C4E03FC
MSISDILRKPDISPHRIKLIDKRTYEKIIFDWNRLKDIYPLNTTIVEMFEEQVKRTPHKTAVIFEGNAITYQKLNEQANKLGSFLLRQYNVIPNDLIALYIDRSIEAIIAMIATLKSGAAYVPISPDYPDERIKYILSDTKAKSIITNAKYKDRIYSIEKNISIVEIENSKEWSKYNSTNFKTDLSTNDLAYIIYTSGTTGIPKGVEVEHHNTCRLINDMSYSIINESDNILGLSNFIFDASIYDIWASLFNGATLVLSKQEDFLDFDKMDEIFKKYKISNLFMTTALFNSMVDANLQNISYLKYLLFGGEKTSTAHVIKFKERYKTTQLINMYGPTECTTYATSFDISELGDKDITFVPIGVHINNTTTYVLDKYLNPLPVGAIGELYIGGDGV